MQATPSGGRASTSGAASATAKNSSPTKQEGDGAKSATRKEQRAEKKKQQESVLLNAKDLEMVLKDATKGGKKKLGGLYMPDGKKLEVRADDTKVLGEGKQKNEKTQQDLHLTHVARKYGEREKKKREDWEKGKQKGEEDVGDADMQRRAQHILAHTADNDKIEFQELFNLFDVDKDRTWGSIEVAQVMVDLGYVCTVEHAANMLYFAGVRDIDRITYEDFICMMPKLAAYRRLLEREAMEAFAASDADGSGTLGRNEIRNAITILSGGDLDEQQLVDLIDAADVQHTGEITYNDYMMALFGVKPMVKYEPLRRPSLLARMFGPCCGKASNNRNIKKGAGSRL